MGEKKNKKEEKPEMDEKFWEDLNRTREQIFKPVFIDYCFEIQRDLGETELFKKQENLFNKLWETIKDNDIRVTLIVLEYMLSSLIHQNFQLVPTKKMKLK